MSKKPFYRALADANRYAEGLVKVAFTKVKPDVMYRYEDVAYAAPANEFGESRGPGTVEVHLQEYRVIRRTPKGAWIDLGAGTRRFVLENARKRFALPTVEEARESFLARKRKQIRIYEARIYQAKMAIQAIGRLDEV